jgi:hypothetical protein
MKFFASSKNNEKNSLKRNRVAVVVFVAILGFAFALSLSSLVDIASFRFVSLILENAESDKSSLSSSFEAAACGSSFVPQSLHHLWLTSPFLPQLVQNAIFVFLLVLIINIRVLTQESSVE